MVPPRVLPSPTSHRSGSLCPACQVRRKFPHYYLCKSCWFSLPVDSRRLLWRQDADARRRLFRLYEALSQGRPLAQITRDIIDGRPVRPDGGTCDGHHA